MKKILFALASIICNPLFSAQLGNITSINEQNNEFEIKTSNGAVTKLIFYRPDIFRIWVGPNGHLTNPASEEETSIVVYNDNPIKVNQSEENDYYKIESDAIVLRIYKNPCMFSLYKKDNSTLLLKKINP